MELKILTLIFYIQGAFCYTFDDDFSFGVGTSAYQIEGAWNVSGKGYSLWDNVAHTSSLILDGSNGDIACNSYYMIDEDVRMLKELGANHYRFSVAWTRIVPTGLTNNINEEGIAYYNELINKLLAEGIEPWVTIYHWDLPYGLNLKGGFYNPSVIQAMTDYADILFARYGDRVKTWITINEPFNMCNSGVNALGRYVLTGVANYECGLTLLRTHTSIYRLYQKKYRRTQKGKLSMAMSIQGYLPATDSAEDIAAANRVNQFELGWFAHPLVHGNYPPEMREAIAINSEAQNFSQSRLPELSCQELQSMKGAYDYLGINNYDIYLVSASNVTNSVPSIANDYRATLTTPAWNSSYTIQMKVQGFARLLKWIKDNYNDPEIKITEQGIGTTDFALEDTYRRSYLAACLTQLSKSIHEDQVRVTGYTFWSLMDNFEWAYGYTVKYGLYHVDFTDPNRTRTARISSLVFSHVATLKTLEGLEVE